MRQGACTASGWAWDDTHVWSYGKEIVPTIGSGSLINESIPIGNAAAGYLTLASPVSGTAEFGIWLMIGAYDNFTSISAFNPIAGLFPNSVGVHSQTFQLATAQVVSSETYNEASDAEAMGINEPAVDTKDMAIYLGKVTVDQYGNGTVTTYRKSDISFSGQLIFAPVIVSGDTSGGLNTITEGSDGGAYLP